MPTAACIASSDGRSFTTARSGCSRRPQHLLQRNPHRPPEIRATDTRRCQMGSNPIDRSTQQIGFAAEEAAALFLRAEGFTIVLRNFRRRLGELDIIARAQDVLIIAEVRTRSGLTHGGAAASVGLRKQ